MIERHHPDPADRADLTEQDLAIATLVGRYIERREAGQPPFAHDLFAVAAEFGDTAVDALGTRARLLRGDARDRRPRSPAQHHRPHNPGGSPMPALTSPPSIAFWPPDGPAWN
jgi:hypothetical protein